MSGAATLDCMAKNDDKTGKGAKPNRKADAQLNIRFERAFLDSFDGALSQLVPKVAEKAFIEMVIESFIIDPQGFVDLVRTFRTEKMSE